MATAVEPHMRPWGADRLAPYPTVARRSHASATLDPDTQLGVFTDRVGTVIEMGKHGTARGTETSTVTNSDSAPDQGHDQDSVQD
ncbi:putative ATP-grasp-modified RiPP [Streptomyces sp. CS7]|uniref:putative ATP-grasp-modified RiPP n=1 Tax=Streptomyces sp. CS-7 TaxID=2906769 RepID=UPI0021B4BF9F|nr:putative ATP-grasp-modified RiPP [Streptomyces sp. CS-7]MCT6776347.1 putative ATP-grasp-modified RiPP [Streptomyces sp. CS-7]